MTDLTTPTVRLDVIHAHENNPRRLAVADHEMVESVRAQGIAQALTIMPNLAPCAEHADVDCYVLGAGHRRRDAATKAGLVEVPVVYRDDLVTEAQQLEFMLVENLHREDLTAVEEAAAYEQLTLQGMDAAAIAAATGRNASTVKARLKLNGLAESTRERLHDGQMTLGDAEALLEFADDPDATALLESRLGTPNFRYAVTNARHARDRRQRRASIVAEFEKAGAVEAEPDTEYAVLASLPDDLADAAAHDACLGYRVPPSEWSEPYLVCRKPANHPIPEPPAARPAGLSEWEKRQAERAERRAVRRAAADVRIAWLREHFTGLLGPRTHGPLAAAFSAFGPLLIAEKSIDSEILLTSLGAMPEQRDYTSLHGALDAHAATLPTAKPTAALATLAGYLAAVVAEQLDVDEPAYFDDIETVGYILGVWDWLKAAGYELSDADKDERTALEGRHTELATEAEAEAS